MRARTASSRVYAAGLTAILAAALAGCAAASSGTAATNPSTSSTASSGLASKTTSGANSFTGTMSLQVTPKPGSTGSHNVSFSATMAEQLHPSLLAQVNVGSVSGTGSTLPPGLDEIATPTAIYVKWPFLTQALHLTKPWLAIPLAAMSKLSGISFSQLFSQATSSSPLSESQMLAGATSVHKAGTGTLNGVAVTEYTGTLSLDKAIQYLSGSVKAQVQKEMSAAGLTTGTFTVWIDDQHTVRKAIIDENGTAVTETTTFTVDTLNQPVNIAVPTAGQTSQLPASTLAGLSS
jgi:hypothetical protein